MGGCFFQVNLFGLFVVLFTFILQKLSFGGSVTRFICGLGALYVVPPEQCQNAEGNIVVSYFLLYSNV